MRKILIVEDDPLTAEIYTTKLRMDGFSVEVAGDGEAGLQQVIRFGPDIVLLDLMIPKLSGVDLIRQIRARNETKRLPIVVMTNAYATQQIEEAWQAGATKCLKKIECSPNNIVDLLLDTLTTSLYHPKYPSVQEVPKAILDPVPIQKPVVATKNYDIIRRPKIDFVKEATTDLSGIREMFLQFTLQKDSDMRLKNLDELQSSLRTLTNKAILARYREFAQFSSSLAALLQDFQKKSTNINVSTLQTAAQAIDFLGQFGGESRILCPETARKYPPNILIVDDEPICRELIASALQRAELNAIGVDTGALAVDLLKQNPFDIIFLDVYMPDMLGFDLCQQIRNLENNKNTPVVFVTSLTDFETKVNTKTSGGSDTISKPFVMTELMVKSLLHLFMNSKP